MACEAVEMWSLSSLISAFLDLIIAYLLFCALAVAFIASKFLNFFGLSLPCPCDGLLFGIHSQSLCLNRLLVDFPFQKVSDVMLSVKQIYPFSGCVMTNADSTCVRTNTDSSIAANSSGKDVLQLDFDASCSSISDTRTLSIDGGNHSKDLNVRDERKYDVKGKGIVCHKPRTRLRSRHKWSSDHGKNMPLSSYNRRRGGEALAFVEERQRALTSVMMSYCPDEDLCNRNIAFAALKLHDDYKGDFFSSSEDDEKRTVRALEKALVEERACRATLYIELEKERSASATAADEAMSMILRLQEEKACIEMEARQYQRIIEEKSAYDAEEMNILKEILVRREKEKLFLEKEVESYRQMMLMEEDDDDNKFAGDALDKFCSPPQVAAFTEKQVERSIIHEHGDLPEISMPTEHKFVKKIDSADAQEVEEIENLSPEEKIIVTCDKIETGNPYNDTSMEQQEKDEYLKSNYSGDLASYQEYNNVHIIQNVSKESDFSAGSSSSQVLHEINYVPVESSITTSAGTVTNYLSTSRTDNNGTIRPRALSLLSELRKSSMSCADNEIIRTDTELGKLLEKLKLVQEGRHKLISLPSVENHEKEDMRTKSLDDIEARHLSDSGKVSPQVLLKKRRCRSVSSRTSKGKYDAYGSRI